MSYIIRIGLFLGALLCCISTVMGQSDAKIITGKVIDADSGDGIPYATVVFQLADDSVIGGTSTDESGQFRASVNAEDIKIQISFIGYETLVIENRSLNATENNLGEVGLTRSALALEEAEVAAEKSTVEFKLDKRVFNVGKDISSTGAGALEVLDQVPSVNVDIEGNITLRGNGGVQILIDGKPSVLSDDGANALGTITSDMIEKVEVITNPSAKYEAGGTSGILNIVLKKEEKTGINGSISVNTGIPDNHSIGASLNYRTKKLNLFTQLGGGYRSLPRFNESTNINRLDSTIIESDGVAYRNEQFVNILLGSDFYLNDFNTITISGNYALELEDQPSETDFNFYSIGEEAIPAWERTEVTSAVNPKWRYDVQYEKQFKDDKEHKLQFSALGNFFGKDLESEFTNTALSNAVEDEFQQTASNFFQSDYTFKLDYTDPVSELVTLETGFQYQINDVGNEFKVSDLVDGVWVVDSGLTNTFEWNQKVLGVYGTAAYEKSNWGVKLGLRVENTDLNTFLVDTEEANDQNYTNLFPTAHASWKATERFSLQAGYSRRIFRPRLWDLNPFFNIRNAFNIRQGNPDLQPEFADSYELTAIMLLPKVSLNGSVYHLYTTEVVERVSFFENNVNVTMPLNIGTENKTGIELNGKYEPMKWLTLTGDFNYGFFQRRGEFQDQRFDFNGDQWEGELTAKMKLQKTVDFEVSGEYNSSVITVQGRQSASWSLDLGLRKKLWKGKGVINASVRDLFATRIRETVIDRDDFYLYSFSQRGTFFTLGFSYSFGKGEAMTYSGRVRR
ncbi:outer membrane beta-barrel family protein [Sanyastnella coralliicola]|uniref:outer membrane beta-barrel family protein n=1 Tax=Sanyastnella coralliicola TaxID=3069118 RepID=UPI0027B93759|nr:outer membrane beta-barrel family protein [Longitalea sp. SCSIO 12813]